MDPLLELADGWAALEPFAPEDAKLLRSVRSFLDELDALPPSPSPSPSALSPPSPPRAPLLLPSLTEPLAPPQQPTTAKRKRRRPQEEVDALRRQVYELTAQLEALRFQEVHGARVDPTLLRATPPSSWRLLPADRPPWRAVAAAQRELRRQAELDRLWLRALVTSTASRAQHVRDAFERHIDMAKKRARMENPLILAPRAVLWTSEPVFHELLAGLDPLYLVADKVMAAVQPLPEQLPVQQLAGGATVFGESFITFVESRVLPFQLSVVNRALWRALLGQSSRVYPNYQRDLAEEISDDTMLTASRLGVRRGDSDLDIWIYVATRRYIEPGRVVVASRTLVKPKTTDSGAAVGVTYRETRLRVLKAAGDTGNLPSSTVMQSHLAVYRESAIEEPGDGWNDGQDTAFAAQGWRHSILALNQAIENLVLYEMTGWSK